MASDGFAGKGKRENGIMNTFRVKLQMHGSQ